MRLFHSPLNNVIYLSIYIKKKYCSLPCPSLTILRLKQKPTLLDLRNDLISFKNVRQFSKLPKMQVKCIIHSLQKKKKREMPAFSIQVFANLILVVKREKCHAVLLIKQVCSLCPDNWNLPPSVATSEFF